MMFSRATRLWDATVRRMLLSVPTLKLLWAGTAMRWREDSSVTRTKWLPD